MTENEEKRFELMKTLLDEYRKSVFIWSSRANWMALFALVELAVIVALLLR